MNNKKNNTYEYNPKKVLTQREAMEEPVGSFYHPTEKTYRSGACPRGQNLKRGYKRKAYTKENGKRVPETYVNAICIENKGLPGKVLNKYRVIKINQEDLLKEFGYSTRLSSDKRFELLLKAASKLSYRSVVARINAIRILSRSNKHLYKIYTEDLKNLRKWRNENPELYKNKNMNINMNINKNNFIIQKQKKVIPSNNLTKVVTPSNNLTKVVTPSNNLTKVVTSSNNSNRVVSSSNNNSNKAVTPSNNNSNKVVTPSNNSNRVVPSSNNLTKVVTHSNNKKMVLTNNSNRVIIQPFTNVKK